MDVFTDIAAARQRAIDAFRPRQPAADALAAYVYLDLAYLHVESGRFTAATAWLRRAQSKNGGACGEFAARCVEAALAYELLHGNAAGLCVIRNELTEASPSTIWAESRSLDGALADLPEDERDWCLPHYALMCRYRLQDRRSQVLAGWAAGSEAAAQRLGLAHLVSSTGELDALSTVPLSRLRISFDVAGLAWTVRRPDVAEIILRTADAIAPDGLKAAVAAHAALTRFDAVHAPLSSAATWNLNVRISERECSELGKSIERAEFRSPSEHAIGADLTELERISQQVPPAQSRPVAIALALRRAFAYALAGSFGQAATACELAVTECAALGDRRELPRALSMALIARISECGADDLRAAQGHFDALVCALRRMGSRSWALGCCLLLSRWGRHSLIQRGSFPSACASFSFAYRLAREFRLATHAAQSLVDLAVADESIGFRHVTCARLRLAAAAFIDACEKADVSNQVVFNRAVFVLQRSATAYAYEWDTRATSIICEDLERVLELVARRSAAAGEADHRTEGDLWVRHAKDQLKFLRVIDCLAAVFRARREGDTDAVARALERARRFMDDMAAGDRAFWELQFARESNDLQAAARAAATWAAVGLAGGPLHEIEQILAHADGDLARDELHVHRVDTHITHLKVLLSIRRYQEAAEQLGKLEKEAGAAWFDAFAQHRLLGRLDKAKVLLGCGQAEPAWALCQTLLVLYEDLEAQVSDDSRLMSVSIEPGLSDAYVLAAAAAHALGDSSGAFALAEAGRARALKYLIAHREQASAADSEDGPEIERLALGIDVASDATERYVTTRARASDLRGAAIFDADAVLDGRSTLSSASRPAASAPARLLQRQFREQANVEAIVAHCPPDGALLAFSFVEDTCLSWALDAAGTLRTHRLPVETRFLNDLIARYLRACRTRADLGGLGQQLGTLLLAPHRDLLESKTKVVIVPHGDAFRLPLHALPLDESGQCLGANRAVSYLPAAALLTMRAGSFPHHDNGPPLVMGCPYTIDDSIHRELRSVAATLGCDADLSNAMGRDEVLQRLCSARLIHIAAHATKDDVQPWNSALWLFGPGNPLTAADIGRLPLRAELVTLGACSTGASGRARSDLTGFSRALLAAGVGTCVVSLWDVDNAATEVLMSHFYRAIRTGASPSLALAGAQALVRQGSPTRGRSAVMEETTRLVRLGRAGRTPDGDSSWSHPYYWAGFVATGPSATG